MVADVDDDDALVRLEEINVERFEDPGENAIWQGHCVASKCMACAWQGYLYNLLVLAVLVTATARFGTGWL